MGFFTDGLFALFSLVELSNEDLNSILQQAYKASTVDQWEFYLATNDYAAIPREPPGIPYPTGTEAPVPESFSSPFVGKSVRDVATWLSKKPENTYLDGHFFAVLDKKAKQSKVVLCRIGDDELKGDALSCVLMPAEDSSLTLSGMEYGTWEELVDDAGEYEPEL